jgi:hypothetical protein
MAYKKITLHIPMGYSEVIDTQNNPLVYVKSFSYKLFVYLRLLITPLLSVKSFSYKPFVYLRLLITPVIRSRKCTNGLKDNDFTDTNVVIRSRKYTNDL